LVWGVYQCWWEPSHCWRRIVYGNPQQYGTLPKLTTSFQGTPYMINRRIRV